MAPEPPVLPPRLGGDSPLEAFVAAHPAAAPEAAPAPAR